MKHIGVDMSFYFFYTETLQKPYWLFLLDCFNIITIIFIVIVNYASTTCDC